MVYFCDKKRCLFIGVLMLLLLGSPSIVRSQDTYYAEFGINGGGAFALGDANGVLFKNLEPVAGAYIKYKFNGRYELKAQLDGGFVGVGVVNGAYRKTHVIDFKVLGEFNFFNFGGKFYDDHWSWISPYITLGIGVAIFERQAAPAIPMGVGVKIKLSDRVNVGASWIATKLLGNDAFDGIDDPIGLNAGIWNNRDWYSSVQLSLSFGFVKICKPCHNGVVHF